MSDVRAVQGNAAERDRVVYRWPRVRLVQPVGRLVIALGVAWLVVTIGVTAMDMSATPWFTGLGVASLVLLAAAGLLLARPPRVLEVTDSGYRVHNLRGAGTTASEWSQVSRVTTGESVAGPVLVFEGSESAPTAVPLALLGAQADDAQRRVRALLQARRPGSGSDT